MVVIFLWAHQFLSLKQKPHNQMLLGKQDKEDEISEEGKVLV